MRGEKMQEITIYNKNGEPLTELAQWDKNIQIQVRENTIDRACKVHFLNCNSTEAMVMESAYKDGILTVPVPNDILMEPHPITGYLWMEKNSEEKSVLCFRIMVRKRPRPANYVYKDQKEYITFKKVLEDALEYAARAENSAQAASLSEANAKSSSDNADEQAALAKDSADTATEKAAEASTSATNADTSATSAENSAVNAEKSAQKAESFAHGLSGARENENTDNAMYYYEQAKNNSNISKEYLTKVEKAGADAVDAIKSALDIDAPVFSVDLSTGHLMYEGGRFMFQVNSTGHLEWRLAV